MDFFLQNPRFLFAIHKRWTKIWRIFVLSEFHNPQADLDFYQNFGCFDSILIHYKMFHYQNVKNKLKTHMFTQTKVQKNGKITPSLHLSQLWETKSIYSLDPWFLEIKDLIKIHDCEYPVAPNSQTFIMLTLCEFHLRNEGGVGRILNGKRVHCPAPSSHPSHQLSKPKMSTIPSSLLLVSLFGRKLPR